MLKKSANKKFSHPPQKKIKEVEAFIYFLLEKLFNAKGAFITDESSLWDFDSTITSKGIVHKTKKALQKIKKLFGVDVSKVKDLNLYEIAKKIQKESKRIKIYSKEEYIKAAEDRIRDFAKCAGEEIGGFTMTAIHKELKTMFDIGNSR